MTKVYFVDFLFVGLFLMLVCCVLKKQNLNCIDIFWTAKEKTYSYDGFLSISATSPFIQFCHPHIYGTWVDLIRVYLCH